MSDTTHPTASNNPFTALAAINVNDHVERKGGFAYLSWPFAVAQLRQFDPTATWEVRRFDGLPFLATEAGVFVEVAVTVQGVTLSQIHPVLDGRNRPLMAPSAFDINPDGHPKLLHLWPVKLLQAGRGDYGDSVVTAMRDAASFSR